MGTPKRCSRPSEFQDRRFRHVLHYRVFAMFTLKRERGVNSCRVIDDHDGVSRSVIACPGPNKRSLIYAYVIAMRTRPPVRPSTYWLHSAERAAL